MFEHEQRTRKSGQGAKLRERDIDISEDLTVRTKGSIIHPRLFEFTLNGILGFDQGQRASSASSERKSGRVQGLDFLGTFLKEHDYSASVFGHIQSDVVKRKFGEDVYNDSTRYGMSLRYRNDFIPVSMRVERNKLTTDTGRENFFEENQSVNFRASHDAGRSSTHLDYTFTQTEETRSNKVYNTTEATLTNSFEILDKNKMRLNSRFRLFDQSGDLLFRNVDFDERLHWNHSKNLETRYRYLFSIRESEQERADRHTVSAGLTHQLFQSLRTVVRLYGYTEEIVGNVGNPDGARDLYRGNVDLHYTKNVPGGRLLVSVGAGHEVADEQFDSPGRIVLDEPANLIDGVVELLTNTGVDRSSVVVTNAAGAIFYVENIDYTLHDFGLRTEIRRIPTGLIADGDTVLVDYSFTSDPSIQYATSTQRFGVRAVLFEMFTPYFRVRRQVQDLLSGTDTGSLEDVDSHVIGIDFYYKGFSFTQEFEDDDSSITPYRTALSRARYVHTFGTTAHLAVHATRQITEFGGSTVATGSTQSNLLNSGTEFKTRLTEHSVLNLSADFRRDETRGELSRIWETSGEYRWAAKALEISVGWTLQRFRETRQDEDRNYFFLKLIRRF